MPKYAKKVDANQPKIVMELRDQFIQVHLTSSLGNDFPDLLCANGGKWLLVEIKEIDGALDRGQMRFICESKGPVAVCTSSAEVVRALGIGGISREGKYKLQVWLVMNPNQRSLSLTKFRKVIG